MAKKCSKCGRSKPESQFHRNAARADGLQTACKACTNRTSGSRKRATKSTSSTRSRKSSESRKSAAAKKAKAARDRKLVDEAIAIERAWFESDQSLAEVAEQFGTSARHVARTIRTKLEEYPDQVRGWISAELWDLVREMRAEGWLNDARRTLMDIARLNGLASTGGNTIVNVRTRPGDETSVTVTPRQQVARDLSAILGSLPEAERAELVAGVQADVVEGEVVD